MTTTDATGDTAALPSLDDVFPLDDATVARFAADGHTVVRGLASPAEAAAFHPIVEAAAIEHAWNKQQVPADGNLTQVFLQSFNLWRIDERIARFVLARRFADVAARLLGVERVRLYHDQSLCKGPGGGRTPWHQDQYYWPLDTDRTITMWMPLVDIPPEVGSMTFVPGSHRRGDLGTQGIGRETDELLRALIEAEDLPTATHGPMKPGDATFHTGWTVHSAGRNGSDRLRTVMTVIYFADGARVRDDTTPAQEVDRRAWLGDRPRGALADHEMNPILG